MRVPVLRRVLNRLVYDTSGCLLWPGAKTSGGYGLVSTTKGEPPAYVHKVMYEAYHGPVPRGLEVRHSCHVRHCASPVHLSMGTHAQNMRDLAVSGDTSRIKAAVAVTNRRRWALDMTDNVGSK